MNKELEKVKEKRIKEIEVYANSHTRDKFDRNGNKIDVYVDYNPIVVSEKFFKKLYTPKEGVILYTSEQLNEFYELYRELVIEVNDKIGTFPTSLPTFCKLIGITVEVLKQYRDTANLEMKKTIDRIYDEINDDNLFLSQLGQASEKSTMFKLKSINEVTEKKAPNVNVNLKGVINQAKYDAKLEKYQDLLLGTSKKGKKKEQS